MRRRRLARSNTTASPCRRPRPNASSTSTSARASALPWPIAPQTGGHAHRINDEGCTGEAQRQRDALSELEAGARSETIARARAQLAAAQAQVHQPRTYYIRVQPLGARQLIAASEVDRARAAANSAEAQVRAAQAALLELENGTRSEQIAQGEAAARVAISCGLAGRLCGCP